jgi:hypothetical protein
LGLTGRTRSVAGRRAKAIRPILAAGRRRPTWTALTTRPSWANLSPRTAWASREAEPAGPAGAAHGAASLHDFFNALGDGLPLGVILHVELFAHTFHCALVHLRRIEVALRWAILSLKVSRAEEQPGDCPKRADNDRFDLIHTLYPFMSGGRAA